MSQAIADQLDADPARSSSCTRRRIPPSSRRHAPGAFRASVGIPDDVPLVGAAGRIDSWKGFDVLLDAYERAVKRRRPDLHLVVAGGPVDRQGRAVRTASRRGAAALPGAHWLGARSDVPDLLADLDVFVLPSTEPEPYGLVVGRGARERGAGRRTDAGGPREIAAGAAPGQRPPRSRRATRTRSADAILVARARGRRLDHHDRQGRPPRRMPEPDQFAALSDPFPPNARVGIRTVRRNGLLPPATVAEHSADISGNCRSPRRSLT